MQERALHAKHAKDQAAADFGLTKGSYENRLKHWQTSKKAILKEGATGFFQACQKVTQQQLDEFTAVLEKAQKIDPEHNASQKAELEAAREVLEQEANGDEDGAEQEGDGKKKTGSEEGDGKKKDGAEEA